MKQSYIGQLLLGVYFILVSGIYGQSGLPVPDHIVILIFENKAYDQIIGSALAPHINDLANDPYSALFTNSYGIEHPSQPNYIDFFSGCNQGVTDNEVPADQPFTTSNLARQLLDAGRTFISYSEDLPEVGYNGEYSGAYVRRHNPVANWMGTSENQVPPDINQAFSTFPMNDFNLLPDVCFVIPNLNNDMHDGSISAGDTWFYENFSDYVNWAKVNNSLLILTFDEDNYTANNHIASIFTGAMILGGAYEDSINHYSILRTIEDIYGLPYICNAESATSIDFCWNATALGEMATHVYHVFTNPVNHTLTIRLAANEEPDDMKFRVFNLNGQCIIEKELKTQLTSISTLNIKQGLYIYQLNNSSQILDSGKFIID